MKTNKLPLRGHTHFAGLYVHIPFCEQKCHYCGFLSFSSCDDGTQRAYIASLKKEMLLRGKRTVKVDTVFIGGGTPSVLTGEQISDVIDFGRKAFEVCGDAEITIETNPNTLTKDSLAAYLKAGINRLSIGAQSLNDDILTTLGRTHGREDVFRCYRWAREAGFENINIDLMFGIPEQTMELWMETLDEVIDIKPEHISFYSLQLEEGTPFYKQYKGGQLELSTDEEEREMYHGAVQRLKEAGYHHYEISNCALAGYECRHNLKYWSFDEYYGIGLGAHSFLYEQGRVENSETLEEYEWSMGACRLPEGAEWDMRERMGEYVFTGLRRTEGIDTEDFSRCFGQDFFEVYQDCVGRLLEYQESGDILIEGRRVRLTEKGIDRSNEIMAQFV